jgi:ADP-ribose pyrophosphatase YjhB (NUDIX family)
MLKYDKIVRPIAISIIRNGDYMLVYQREDDITREKFYRLVGGCIEFGEASSNALEREFEEELSLQIENSKLISVFESIFTFNSKKMHEIVFLYSSEFKDSSNYRKCVINGLEGTRSFEAVWLPISDFSNYKYKIYPKEIVEYL